MMRLAARVAAYVERFAVAAENLGFINAVKLFALFRLGHRKRNHILRVARLRKDIHFRGAADKGVMAHFFSRGYHIVDTPEQPVRLIIDAGANIGDETIRFRHYHPEATIVALEPDSANFRLLEANIKGDPNVIAHLKGLWSHECHLKVIPGGSNEAYSVTELSAGTGDVQALSVGSILTSLSDSGFTEIDILKLDIEGAEYQVFSMNYESWIRKVKVIIVECPDYDRPGTFMTICRALAHLEFRTYLSGENIVMIRRDVPWRLEVSAYIT